MRLLRFLAPVVMLAIPVVSSRGQVARIYSGPTGRMSKGGDNEPRAALGLSIGGSSSSRDTLGLLVTSVTPSGPAERAGIQEGDRIASLNGVTLRIAPADVGDFDIGNAMSRRLTRELSRVRPGEEVDLRVFADGRTRTIRVRTADADSLYTRRKMTKTELEERPTLGFSIGATSSRRDSLGVLVMFVDDSGPAARIAAIDDVDLRVGRDDAGDGFSANSKVRRLQREVSRLRPGDNVDLRVYANGEFRTVRLRAARAADLPRRRGAFIISGDNFGMLPGGLALDADGALIGEQVRAAIERAMDTAGHALEGVGRGLGRARIKSRNEDDELPRVIEVHPMEPIEPIHIEPFEPSRLRRVGPSKVPFTTTLLDDSAMSGPLVAATIAAGKVEAERSAGSASLDIAGLRLVAVGSELAAYLGKGSERGLLVVEVPQWARRALRAGDVVLSVDGAPVRSEDGSDDVTIVLPQYRESQLDILRDSVHHTVTLPARR
jgi:S1-C subfamily serine protease